jgi:type IV pilus assembly protein PilB
MDDPTNEAALAEVEKSASLPVRPMIACASDIRSAIRVYYPLDAPPAAAPVPEAAAVAAAAIGSLDGVAKSPLRPKPAKPVRAKGPPSKDDLAPAMDEHARTVAADAPADAPVAPKPAAPPVKPAEPSPRDAAAPARRGSRAGPKAGPRMIAMTLLDGTTLQLPARRLGGTQSEQPDEGAAHGDLTARDLVTALRAVAQGQDATEILGEKVPIEAICAALLSILLKKGLVADWEFVDELRKV